MPSDRDPAQQPELPAPSGIRDNYRRGSVGAFLRSTIHADATLSIVSAYFTIHAFAALEAQLTTIDSLRFLFGEPRFIQPQALDPDLRHAQSFQITETGLKLQTQLQQRRTARACADWIRAKVTIRSVRQANLLHGKLYHIMHPGGDAQAILGSSNFTVAGLGVGTQGNNIELNLEVDHRHDRHDLLAWFNELWHDTDLVADVTDDVLMYLEQLYAHHPPQFIYYLTLFHLFERYLDQQAQTNHLLQQQQLEDTLIWKTLFEFQQDGVRGAINKILTHNGCILADSVGLGKTFEALAVIKYFELRNARVLVLCPKKLRENWTVYQAQNNSRLNPFLADRFSYTVLSHTDLSRTAGKSGDIDLATINWGNYDLVVIDESHNFRNNTPGRRDADGTIIRRSRYERVMDDIIRQGVKTSVLLLSATPVNNTLSDLRNQFMLLTAGQDEAFQSSLGVASVRDTLAAAQKTFSEWAQHDPSHDPRDLLPRLSSALFTLLDALTIARSRRHIQTYYRETVAQLGGFPERRPPESVFVDAVDTQRRFLSYDRLYDEISEYRLSLFNPTAYVLDAYKEHYDRTLVRNFRQSARERSLIGMMRVNFLKRLESSVHAFTITLDRTIEKIEELEARLMQFQQYQADNPLVDFETLIVEDTDDEELQAALQVGKLGFRMAHLDIDRWLTDLRKDKEQLSLVYASAEQVSVQRDAKLAHLKGLIARKVQQPTTTRNQRPNRKVLVFTAFADTASYLYKALCDWAQHTLGIHCAMVTGGTGNNRTTLGRDDFTHILMNFAPYAKKRDQLPDLPQDAEIDLLIGTDCISEGQNLQDCDYLINYDIHWNPVRIIQRFGRIDRIGSPNTAVQLVNFWPTPDLNKYINLQQRVEARMALVDITATGDDNLLAGQLDPTLVEQDMRYRDQQLLRLKDEVLDLDDLNESITLDAFTLDDFRTDLLKYIQRNRQQLAESPLGLYAVVPPHPDSAVIEPGIIYCLRQTGTERSSTINPLHPFFLVYVRDTGEVRYTFAQPRQVLDMYRLLCAERSQPDDTLCQRFDQRTQVGTDVSHETMLLDKAVQSITKTFKQRMAAHLKSGRGAALPEKSQQVHARTDFELITWLVIL